MPDDPRLLRLSLLLHLGQAHVELHRHAAALESHRERTGGLARVVVEAVIYLLLERANTNLMIAAVLERPEEER